MACLKVSDCPPDAGGLLIATDAVHTCFAIFTDLDLLIVRGKDDGWDWIERSAWYADRRVAMMPLC